MFNQPAFRSFIILSMILLTGGLRAAELDDDESQGPRVELKKKDAHSAAKPTSSPFLIFHNGTVLHSSKTAAIFWGNNWNSPTFAGDKISGINFFFDGFGGSSYASTANEYYDTGGSISNQSTYLGFLIDSSTPPSRALKVSQAIAEVCKITNNTPDPGTAYFIYTSTGAGNVNYCAWHSWGECSNGLPLQVAYMPNIDGVTGCDPGDTTTGHSQGLAALANVTAHELMETITDPRGASWYDSSGEENGDKCAWSFPSGTGISTFFNSSQWKLQMEWSNAAYTGNTGQANLKGQLGCIF